MEPDVVATGPNDTDLKEVADDQQYILLRFGRKNYDLYVYDNDEILSHQKLTTKRYADAVMWAITEFIKVVKSDDKSS
jgi:hypothetical protein